MTKLLLTLVLFLFLCSCSNHGVSEENMKNARNAIETKFGVKNVSIVILSDKRMQIGVPSAPFIDSSSGYKQIMADSIALVCKEYIDKETLSRSSVIFLRSPGYITTENEQTHSYSVNLK